MNKKGQVGIEAFVLMFIVIVLGIAFINSSAESTSVMTQKQSATETVSLTSAYVDANNVNESVNITIYSQSDWKVQECPLTSVVITNGADTELTEDTDYVLYADAGVFSLLNTTDTIPSVSLNTSSVAYVYCADGYVTNSSGRSIANLILIFFALALVAAVLELSGIWKWTEYFK